jgi:hypothetical protein
MAIYSVARQAPRYPCAVNVDVVDLRSESHLNGQTKDLSRFGCGIDSLQGFAQGSRVRIKLSYQGAEMTALGRIIYSRPDLGMGIVFTFVETNDERILDGWISELARRSTHPD